jgi:hypothetical protein
VTDKQDREEELMRKIDGLDKGFRAAFGILMLIAVLTAGLQMLSITSLADSAAKVTATSAKIRKEPNTGSDTVGSAEKDAVLSVKGQTTGSDGYTWYQVSVDASTTGYIRSDLITITDGSTPATIVASTTATTTTTTSTATTSTPDETLVEVSEVEAVSASVSGGSPVRVRQNASTTSRIVSTAQSGLALTVTGQATGTDGNEWYQVNFISNGSEVTGFIRADYVSVSGELVPAGTAAEVSEDGEQESVTESESEVETKDWDTYYADDKWHLMDNTTGNSYDIEQIFASVEANTTTLKEALAKNKTQQIIVIILVILLVVLASAVSFLIFKVKDLTDAAYFNEVEQETVRRRTADRPQSSQRSSQQASGQRSGQRNGSAGQQASGQRSGQRTGSANQQASGQRSGQRNGSANQQASGQRSGQRTGSANQQASGQRSGQRTGSANQQASGQRSNQRSSQRMSAQRAAEQYSEDVQEETVQDNLQEKLQENAQESVQQENVRKNVAARKTESQGWKSKNFMDDDEFEFQFLDWNDEEQ